MSAPWTEAHEREALRRLYEIAAMLVAIGRDHEAAWLVSAGPADLRANGERGWRNTLAEVEESWLDADRIGREVERWRGLAEGRLVRETIAETRSTCEACCGTGHVDDEEEGDCPVCGQATPVTCPACNGEKTLRVRVTRIRRAT